MMERAVGRFLVPDGAIETLCPDGALLILHQFLDIIHIAHLLPVLPVGLHQKDAIGLTTVKMRTVFEQGHGVGIGQLAHPAVGVDTIDAVGRSRQQPVATSHQLPAGMSHPGHFHETMPLLSVKSVVGTRIDAAIERLDGEHRALQSLVRGVMRESRGNPDNEDALACGPPKMTTTIVCGICDIV